MKKSLTIVLSLVMLLVSCIPCADSQAFSSNNSGLAQINKTSGDTIPAQDVCPPFCKCHCCTGFSINQYAKLELIVSIAYPQTFPEFSSLPPLEIAYAIWQPPQLTSISRS